MPLEFHFTCPLPNGVHARPASALEEVASCFGADIVLTNSRSGQSANAKSILGIVGADVRLNDACRLVVSGPDECEAMAALSRFLRDEFPLCDEALPPVLGPDAFPPLPAMLQTAGATLRRGAAMVTGLGRGQIVSVGGLRVPGSIPLSGATDFADEVRKLDTALAALLASYEERLPNAASKVEAGILKAHRSVARDPAFRSHLHDALQLEKRTAAGAIVETENHFVSILKRSTSALLWERALDLRDVCFQLLRQIYGQNAIATEVELTRPSIVVAETLTPGQFLALDREYLQGLVLGHAGTTSHTIILARSFGIPTLVGVGELAVADLHGAPAVLDGESGILVTQLTPAAEHYYTLEKERLVARKTRQQSFTTQPALTADGQRIEIGANISTAAEAIPAFAAGAECIGLFRTEILFVDRDQPPTEEEQFEEYRDTLLAASGQPVILRTLDIGGDKPLAYLNLPTEDNPFLGYRAVRIYPEFETIFRTQIRALIRASAHGRLQLMIPMVTTLDEVRWARRVIREEQQQCATNQIPFDAAMKVGAMIEVPAAVFLLEQLCGELDFFSIGTNDLLQYFAGADRANPRVAKLYDPLQPAFLRMLKKIVDEIHQYGKRVGLCGEMGGQLRCLPLLIGLGLDEISASAPAISELKAELALWRAKDCRQLVTHALSCSTADEVSWLLHEVCSRRLLPLVDSDLILVESAGSSKEEVIKKMVDQLYVTRRTDQPNLVEHAIWQRESVYSTGFGHGFAIPHCKTSAVSADSLVMLKLRQPVAWGSLDGEPVSVLLLLVVRDALPAAENGNANGHMKIFSRLARCIMHQEFRDQLLNEHCPNQLQALLNGSLLP